MEESRSARLLRQIKDVCEIAGIKTEEYAKVTRKRLDVLSLTRELNREKSSLGGRVLELSKLEDHGDILEDETVQAILGRIQKLDVSLSGCEEEISRIRESANARARDVRHREEPSSGEVAGEGGTEVAAEEEAKPAGPEVPANKARRSSKDKTRAKGPPATDEK